ncbi:hypothetical protein OAV88_01745 [bacterium]|nr:hypothetical protein [bacterium]
MSENTHMFSLCLSVSLSLFLSLFCVCVSVFVCDVSVSLSLSLSLGLSLGLLPLWCRMKIDDGLLLTLLLILPSSVTQHSSLPRLSSSTTISHSA